MNEDALKFLEIDRYYVFFKDGTWRTCTSDQWKEEQLWKLDTIEYTCWVGGKHIVRVLKAVMDRYAHTI